MLAYQSGSTPGHELIDEPYLVKCVYVRYGVKPGNALIEHTISA